MSQTTDAVIAELMDRRLLNDVDDGLHQEIAEAVIKAAQPAVDEDGPLSTRDLAMIDQAWENYKAALPVATVINDNQPGRTAIIEITIDPPTLPVGTKLYAGPKMVELAAKTSPGDVVDVKAEAKSQEPVAYLPFDLPRWRQYEHRMKRLMQDVGMPNSSSLYQAMGQLIRDVEHIDKNAHPTTKPEAQAVSVDAIKAARGYADRIRWLLHDQPNSLAFALEMHSSARGIMEAIDALITGTRP